jgi:hypothetical protein
MQQTFDLPAVIADIGCWQGLKSVCPWYDTKLKLPKSLRVLAYGEEGTDQGTVTYDHNSSGSEQFPSTKNQNDFYCTSFPAVVHHSFWYCMWDTHTTLSGLVCYNRYSLWFSQNAGRSELTWYQGCSLPYWYPSGTLGTKISRELIPFKIYIFLNNSSPNTSGWDKFLFLLTLEHPLSTFNTIKLG